MPAVTPNPRPIPRFIADSTQEGIPHGRFAERLAVAFREACEGIEELPEGVEPPEAKAIEWFPERAWGGRVWVPATARVQAPGGAAGDSADGGEPASEPGEPASEPGEPSATPGTLELFGHVSYVQPEGGEPEDFRAAADFTDILAEDNPEWRIDLNDEVIGRWRGENGRAGAVTLVWGRPLVRGAVAATAELDGETVDQEALSNERFTLIALDALEAYGDDIFMQVKLWSSRAVDVASESLYA